MFGSDAAWNGMFKSVLWYFIITTILGLWKLVEIIIWTINHVKIDLVVI